MPEFHLDDLKINRFRETHFINQESLTVISNILLVEISSILEFYDLPALLIQPAKRARFIRCLLSEEAIGRECAHDREISRNDRDL